MNLVEFKRWAAKGGLRAYNHFAWDTPIKYVLWLDLAGRVHILPPAYGALAAGARSANSLAAFDDPKAALVAYRLMNETGARK